ncbi:collagen binding domain-containing protein [Otoolea muris]|uniref:collagen binding domain-containing protein n=1 Tax=Otoolea muris TaxID=2941515 RepID=UPI00203D3752|nr:SpaA isopeptide-forming pilin-related protein [Otoolea muris]
MRKKRNDYRKAKSPARRGLSFLLAGVMAFSAIAPGLGAYSAYGVTPDKPAASDGSIPNGSRPQDIINTEEVYINDTPVRLQVSKVKTAKGDHEGLNPKTVESALADTITYKVSGRIEGAEHDLMDRYGKDRIELAYSAGGIYLGYGWLKGTLEYLSQRKAQNVDEDIDIKYNQQGVFEGYAYITKTLETADDVNRYVAGATMTLYDAVEIFYDPSADYDMDDKWTGVTVVREPGSNNVQMVYVNKGHAGNRIEYVIQKEDGEKVTVDGSGTEVDDNYNYQDAINDEGSGVWIARTIQREDTPILFYSFDNLHVTTNDEYVTGGAENRKKVDAVFGSQRYNKEDSLYAFDKEGNVINADQYDNRDFSIYAFEDGETRPVFEFTGSNFRNIHYSQNDKKFRFYDEDRNEDKKMRMYHLDEDGNRDAMVDPATGIAYVTEHIKPQESEGSHDNIHRPNDYFLSDKDVKVFVWPVNTFYDGTGNADDNSKGSHYFQKIITTRPASINADTAEEYVFGTLADGKFENSLNPVLDQYGHPVYHRVSGDKYVKGHDRYDYDGEEYLGYTYEDGLDEWNENAYVINDHYHLYNTDEDDPFNQETHYQYTDRQSVKVTVDVDNNFVVNGYNTVPAPSREGYVFAGWLLEPGQLTDKCTVKAYWRNGNNSMPPEEEAMWYSSRGAEGQTKTMTVTFDANGGAFRAGQGDIHSTDFPLYRRLGDAYIINNTWVTGENTPNDPFDTTLIDTVGNTAAGKNTISNDGLTGNDVYSSSTRSGGQADMLKRLPRSLYIMEELKAPAGYVKGMPAPITFNETDNVQMAEMTDHTIKVEILKADATDDYNKKLCRNGEPVKTAGGEYVTKPEAKGAYSYRHVKNASLSMKGADSVTKKAFSDWVSITSCTDFIKKNSGGTWYIEFDTTKPLFLEGIPAGSYTISEVKTPAGFVSMAPQTITVGEYEGVQVFSMADDHIKVEIEKYWTDEDGTRRQLSNSERAELALYDAEGGLVGSWRTDDAGDYTSGGAPRDTAPSGNLFTRAWNAVTSIFRARAASDGTDYTAFTTRFQSVYNDGNTDVDRISWNVRRTASLKAGSTQGAELWKISDGTEVAVTGGIVPEDAPEGFAAAYGAKEDGAGSFEYAAALLAVKDKAATTSMGDQYWNVDNGTVIHICASVDDDSSSAGYQSYIMDYQFEYQKLEGKYAGAVTYLTVDGTRRFDYLPAGNYRIHELEAPEGFAVTGDKEIKVQETGDIQIFDIENKKKEMKIAKYTVNGNGQYFAGYYGNEAHYTNDRAKAAVVAGVNLKLYRSGTQIQDPQEAFKEGKIPAGAALVDSWTTGGDGVYTQYEYDRELITKEMIGQPKPHTVKDVSDGWYYLVEPEGMSYMLDAAPVEFHITQETTDAELAAFAMVNRPAPLAVRINKTDQKGTPLSNAVFELTNKDTGAVIGALVTDENGEAAMNIADTGRFGQDGAILPYTFVLRETTAPAGYALDTRQHEFTLTEQNDGYTCSMWGNSDDSIRGGVLYVKNEPSRISISKRDLYSGEIVPGTVLEVTKAEYTDGKWHSDGNKKSEWTWTVSDDEDEFGLRGITPDTSYVLHESSVPGGYAMQGDVFFHVSKNGLGIDRIWTDPEEIGFISFDTDENGEVEAMHTSTRTIAGTKAVITDLDTGTSFERGVEKNGRILLTAQEVTEGRRYNARTYVTMSDTSVHAVDSVTFLAELVDNEVVVWAQYASDPRVAVTDGEGNRIYEIAADGSDTVILNPQSGHAVALAVADNSRAGKDRSGVKAGDVITYQVDYQGRGKKIFIYPGTGLTISRTAPGALPVGDGSWLYETTEESGRLIITANVNSDALTAVSMKVISGNSQLSYLNPVVASGKTGPFSGNDSLVISNAVTGTDPENGTAEFIYTVTLTGGDGNPLQGSYDYRTRLYSGTMEAYGQQKAFTVTLTGDDYLVINSLPDNTEYKVAAGTNVSDGFKTDRKTAEGTIGEDATVNEQFVSTRNITADRALLKKGQSYYLNEIIRLSDRDHVTAGYGFGLDEKCRVVNFILLNRPSTVETNKLAKETQSPLAGAVLTITDADGNTINDADGAPLTWTTARDVEVFTGLLDPGKTYFLKELSAPEGYTVSEPIPFTVSEDGAVDRVIMQDAVTDVQFNKVDAKTGQPLAGAVLQVIDREGAVVAEWTTDETGSFQMKAKLTAGETYTLHEKETVNGYYYSYDVTFTVNTDGKPQTVEMRNRPIIVVTPEEFPEEPVQTPGGYPFIWLVKGDKAQQGAAGQPVIPGGSYQVIDKAEDGAETVVMEITDPDGDGHFTMTGSWKEWDIVLEADKTYHLRETKAPAGYILPEADTAFTVSHYGEDVVAPVYNEKTRVSFGKKDFAGAEVAGAECELLVMHAGGWKAIDSWVSQEGGPHAIKGVLETGKEYLYRETAAPEGYAYSASIRFTLGKDGSVLHARYVNGEGKSLVYGSDGRATDVIFTETLAGDIYQLNGEELTLIGGNLVDKAGKTVVEGAAVELPVEGNVVIMKDDQVTASFEKTDFAGREVVGAVCTLSEKKADGTTEQIDRWTSAEGGPHTLEKILKTGAAYLYHEELAAAGYSYSYDIAFTVDRAGKIIDAHYLDPDGNKVLYDQAGFPTSIIALDNGTYRDKTTAIEINENGDAVDANGHVYARGVALAIPVTDNVVIMKDEPVKSIFTKCDDNGNALEGGSYSICGEDGAPVKAVKDTSIPSLEHEGMIQKGESLIFMAKKTGIRIDGLLEAGKSYTLKENEAPKGYSLNQTGVTFTAPVYNQAERVAVSMANRKIPARFAKADEDGNLIAGASLELYVENEDGAWSLIRTWRSTTEAMEFDGILESGKNYRYHEAKVPEGYRAAPDILFTVDEAGVIRNARYDGDDTEVKVVNNRIEMTDKPLGVSFAKTDFAGQEVEGAECVLYKKEADGAKTLVDAWTSGKKEHVITGKLSSNTTYIYHEEKAPEGFGYSEDIEFRVDKDGNVTNAHYINGNGETILYDKDGCPTTITVQEDGTYKDGEAVITINTDGNAVDADGNTVAEGVQKDMPVVDNVVAMKDAPTDVKFLKVDSVTGAPLAGAILQVIQAIDGEERVVAQWTTDGTGAFKLEKTLAAGESYILREKETVDGYYYSRDIAFTVNRDGRPQTVMMENTEITVVTPPDKPEEPDKKKPVIWLLKHEAGDPDNILKGGTFQVLSEDKKEVLIDSFTMDGTWQQWDTVLKADHSYWLHEVTPPEGYEVAEDMKFTVSHFGADIQVDMDDEPTDVVFKKVDQLTGVSLPGAVLQVYKGKKKAPYAQYDPADKVAEWTTDETGIFRLTGRLEAGETYTLREQETVDGYYYSYDIEFVVNRGGGEQVVEMQNRKIIVQTPPDELPKPAPEPEGTKPEYAMEKERVSPAPSKAGMDKYGFFHGDKVYYDVTVVNTGEITLTMDVDDAFEEPGGFTEPEVSAVRFFASETGRQISSMGSLNRISGSVANITIRPGGYAVVTYSADVRDQAKEFLSGAAADDGLGYLNTATTANVTGTYKEYSGEDEDGDGKGDTVTEVTVTKQDYPDELGDKEDSANTPVQEPDENGENPSYALDKTRPAKAPEKDSAGRYGFLRGDTVAYEIHIKNTGDMPLKMYVSDEFAYEIRTYFEGLKIVKIDGEDISESGMGVGTDTARIRLEPGREAVVIYEATVSQTAPERLAFLETDDGNGYLNIARTYEVRAEKPDGTEGGPDEYPGIPDKEDDAHTPVQTPEEPPKENPPGPDEAEYPIIWLLKNSISDPSHILPGGTFQILDENGQAVTDVLDAGDDRFGIGNTWKQWIAVLKAGNTYWLHEVTPPKGYLPAEDVKFTVGHYGEKVEVVMTDKRKNDGITFAKQDFAGNGVAGAVCVLYEYGQEENMLIESWVSSAAGHVIKDKLAPGKVYLYHEEKAPEGYGYSVDVVFTVNDEGNVESSHYVDANGNTVLCDGNGYPTGIIVNGDGTYSLNGETVIINGDGDAIGTDGAVLAKQVQAEIPAAGNTVVIRDEPVKVQILKTDESGRGIAGGLFSILDSGKNPVKAISNTEIPSMEHDGFILKGEKLVFTTDGSGVDITGQLSAGKEYYLREEAAPEGFKLADDVMFTIPYVKPGMTTLVRMEDVRTQIAFSKTDLAGKEVEGAECLLYKKEADGTKTLIDAWTSGKEEHVITGKLSSDVTYIYHEEKAPEGYGYSEDIEFTVDKDGNVTRAHYINKNGETILYDKDGYPTTITVQEDGACKDGETIITINADGNAVDADGTIVAKGVQKDIPVVDNTVVMKDAPTDVELIKVDSVTGNPLAGAILQVIQVIDGKEHVIAQWTTDGTGTFKLEKTLEAGESYILREKETVDGYYYSRDIGFTVNTDGRPQTVTMENTGITVVTPPDKPEEPDKEKPVIWLLKHEVGDPNNILKGGTFQVLNEDKKEVLIDSFTMDGVWQQWDTVLKADHSYWLHEVTPPEGYATAEDVKFTVSHYGEDIQVDMEDEPTDVIIKKTDSVTREPLAGATLQILDKDKKVIKEWITDGTGTFKVSKELVKGETYTLRESGTPEGYYYSYDVQFTVTGEGEQVVEMRNREIIVVTPPDEYPDPKPDPQGTHPDYELEKERVSLSPEKSGSGEYGFFRGDRVLYDVTVTNTGETDLSMTVTDSFEEAGYFSVPEATAVRFYHKDGREGISMGELVSMEGNEVKLKLAVGGYAVIRYEADVLEAAKELLSGHSVDDGLGYLNTARTADVTGTYIEYSGEDKDGDGKGDTVTEKTVTTDDYPEELGDKEDTANTPVQEPDEDGENPSYTMDKARVDGAPEKGSEGKYGFCRGDSVDYDVHIANTGDMPLTMYVTDEFDYRIRKYFTGLRITKIDGNAIEEAGAGIGTTVAKIRMEPGEEAIVTFTATVAETAPEKLAFHAEDDGGGYLNVAKTYNVRAQKPDGGEGGPDEYPGIPDKEDEANTPVQTEEEKPGYPYIWILKNEVNDLNHILSGGTFQILSEDKNTVVMENFTMDAAWQQWNVVLEADKTYWLREITPPEGYLKGEDVKFTVSHYGDDIHVSMTDQPAKDEVTFAKEDLSGNSVPGASLEVRKKGTDEAYTWVSNGSPYTLKGKLKPEGTYIYHEISAPEGYAASADMEFTLDGSGVVTDAHFVDAEGNPVLYDKYGFTTGIRVKADKSYELNGETVRIDRNGNAVDKDKKVIAEGVKLEIDVIGNTVIMKDAPTDVTIRKTDSVTGESLAGATLQVLDREENIIAEWITDGTGTFKLEKKLIAGETYILREKETVDGYYYSRDITFTVNRDGRPQTVEMQNREVTVATPPDKPEEPDAEKPVIWLLKHTIGDPEHILKGGTFQVLSEDKTEVLIDNFTMDGTWQQWDTMLQADHSYWLHEVTPPEGYATAEDVKFTVSHYGEDIQVDMADEPTNVVIKKTDSTTGQPLAGAVLQVLDKDRNVVAEWTTDGTGIFRLEKKLTAGETYILHEKETVEGYYYSYDVPFTVSEDGKSQIIEMRNREIKVATPPDEIPEPKPEPQGTHPDYELEKERVSSAPQKSGRGEYGFFHGDRVLYDVTVTNTGETDLFMTVTDSFEEAGYFSTPKATAVRFYHQDGREGTTMGELVSMEVNEVKLKLAVGGYAVIRYEADVLEAAKELLSGHRVDDGLGYLNTARATDVTGTYTEYSGEDRDGDGKGDTVTEKTVTKDDYPDELGDKEDTANTPVQEPDENGNNPSYAMDKTRTARAPEKEGSGRYGFSRGDTVTYVVRISNTGGMPLTMYVTDEFDYRIRKYFEDLTITEIDGEAIEEAGVGVGTTVAKIRILPGEEAAVTFTAKVAQTAPEKLSFHAQDDGSGYLNVAKTYDVKAEKPDGTEGGPDEYPGIPDKEDEGNTPVQTDNKPDYPYIWLLKNEVNNPDHILTGGVFQVLSEDKEHILIDSFTMNGEWQQWDAVLEADKSYWLHEVSAPAGYKKARDVKFTVSHYGEDVQAVMSDEKLPNTVTFTKEDFAGQEIPGAECELRRVEPNGATTLIDSWISGGEPYVMEDMLSGSTTYRYHEEKAPDGYGYSEDIEFTVDENGKVTDAHYVDKDGTPLLYDKDGFPTAIAVQPDGTYKDGDTMVTIDQNGNAVDRQGHIHAEGVKYEIEVVDNVVRMKDAPSRAVILKQSTNGEALAGGQFVIRRGDGSILEALRDTQIPSMEHDGSIRKGEAVRFAARGGGVEITGLLNGSENYILHEEKAPEGYDLASDVTFTAPRDGRLITVTMHDAKTPDKPEEPEKPTEPEAPEEPTRPDKPTRPTSPDKPHRPSEDGGNTPSRPYVTVYKYDGNTMEPISGVTFQVYRDGEVFKKVKTDRNGYARVSSLTDGDYRIVEAEAAKGYQAAGQEFTFTVTSGVVAGGVTTFHAPNYRQTTVTVTKRDGDTGALLKGARLCVADEDGGVACEGVTDKDGKITFQAAKPGHYAVIELEAPEGYDVVDGYITFHVSENGAVEGATTMYDYKRERRGRITARYENGFKRGGWYDSDGGWHKLPPTGDDGDNSRMPYLFGIFAASMSGIVILSRKKRKKKA